MLLNLAESIARLGANAAFRIVNAARAPGDYLFAAILPERPNASWNAKTGTMTVKSTMAGMVGMDSPYPPTGVASVSTFEEATVKVANEVTLTEQTQRELLTLLQSVQLAGGNAQQVLDDTVLNFIDKVIAQAHLDTAEYLRGQALVLGAIDWTFNQKRLQVDYAIPSANKLTARTGTAGYGGSASTFWADMRASANLVKGGVAARLAHPDTIAMIQANDANKVRVIAQDDQTGTVTLGRIVGSTEQLSPDARDVVTLIAYGAEGETLDPANPGSTIARPFLSTGKVVTIGRPAPRGFQIGTGAVGQGGSQSANAGVELGYTHLGPTIESGGALGRWADVMTPQNQPWQIVGRGVTNLMPVIETPEKIAIATTEMV